MTKREEAALKRQHRLECEIERVHGMRVFERNALLERFGTEMFPEFAEGGDPGMVLICGVDEAGRGPLAGPVAAGACILPADHDILYINDSKRLSPRKRDQLFDTIKEEALAWHVALVGPERIDEINILQATYEAMREAIAALNPAPAAVVADAVTIPGMTIPQVGIVKGDAKCASIAAASILAKVTRDRLMEEYDTQYPEYGFAGHKGYGTKAHIDAIKEYGPCPIHRRTFITHFV